MREQGSGGEGKSEEGSGHVAPPMTRLIQWPFVKATGIIYNILYSTAIKIVLINYFKIFAVVQSRPVIRPRTSKPERSGDEATAAYDRRKRGCRKNLSLSLHSAPALTPTFRTDIRNGEPSEWRTQIAKTTKGRLFSGRWTRFILVGYSVVTFRHFRSVFELLFKAHFGRWKRQWLSLRCFRYPFHYRLLMQSFPEAL